MEMSDTLLVIPSSAGGMGVWISSRRFRSSRVLLLSSPEELSSSTSSSISSSWMCPGARQLSKEAQRSRRSREEEGKSSRPRASRESREEEEAEEEEEEPLNSVTSSFPTPVPRTSTLEFLKRSGRDSKEEKEESLLILLSRVWCFGCPMVVLEEVMVAAGPSDWLMKSGATAVVLVIWTRWTRGDRTTPDQVQHFLQDKDIRKTNLGWDNWVIYPESFTVVRCAPCDPDNVHCPPAPAHHDPSQLQCCEPTSEETVHIVYMDQQRSLVISSAGLTRTCGCGPGNPSHTGPTK
ncbi:hypothetical protein CRUP_012668 [Coryphaenoides rupestris]|nr:hypothetical protein CRUP_012668 [Coryphaenoides rupestris]